MTFSDYDTKNDKKDDEPIKQISESVQSFDLLNELSHLRAVISVGAEGVLDLLVAQENP
jgi:hypothetical protein